MVGALHATPLLSTVMIENTHIQIAILAPTLAVRVGLRTLLGVSDSVQIVTEIADPTALADMDFDVLATVKACKKARLRGVMMDTAGKDSGSLLTHRSTDELTRFVQSARNLGLLTGLAGSLKQQDIDMLLPVQPDYIGFRTALCKNLIRTNPVSEQAIISIRNKFKLPSQAVNHA